MSQRVETRAACQAVQAVPGAAAAAILTEASSSGSSILYDAGPPRDQLVEAPGLRLGTMTRSGRRGNAGRGLSDRDS